MVTRFANKKSKVSRPLLKMHRFEIRQFIRFWKLPVYSDQSNKKTNFSRNRVRKQLMPTLRVFFNPQIDTVLLNFAEIRKCEQSYFKNILNSLLKPQESYPAFFLEKKFYKFRPASYLITHRGRKLFLRKDGLGNVLKIDLFCLFSFTAICLPQKQKKCDASPLSFFCRRQSKGDPKASLRSKPFFYRRQSKGDHPVPLSYLRFPVPSPKASLRSKPVPLYPFGVIAFGSPLAKERGMGVQGYGGTDVRTQSRVSSSRKESTLYHFPYGFQKRKANLLTKCIIKFRKVKITNWLHYGARNQVIYWLILNDSIIKIIHTYPGVFQRLALKSILKTFAQVENALTEWNERKLMQLLIVNSTKKVFTQKEKKSFLILLHKLLKVS